MSNGSSFLVLVAWKMILFISIAKGFIKSLLVADPIQRPTAEKALEDPWVQVSNSEFIDNIFKGKDDSKYFQFAIIHGKFHQLTAVVASK